MQQSPEDALQRWSPEQPLSEAELELLAQFESRGRHVGGLKLKRRRDGQTYVLAFDPSCEDQPGITAAGLSLDQLGSWAVSLHARGECRLASEAFALELRLRIFQYGPENPETLTAANNLSTTLSARGDLAGARKIEELVFDTRRRAQGAAHPDTLTSANNLTNTLHTQGDIAGARRIQESVFETCLRLLGAEHQDTLRSANSLASTLRAQGDLAGARRIHEMVYEVRRRLLGADHLDTLTSAGNLANVLGALGDLAGARKIEESVYKTSQRVLGAEHRLTLGSANNLALTLRAQGDLVGARRMLEVLYEPLQRTLGATHPDTLCLANNLAETLRAQGDLADARGLQESVLEISQRVLGAEHQNTLNSANNLALILRAQGDPAGSRRIQEWVYMTRQRVLGAAHPDTLSSANNLGLVLLALGDRAAAGTLATDLVERLCRAGVSHEAGFPAAANLPFLAEPDTPWSSEVLKKAAQWLPRLGVLLTQHLDLLAHESWDEPYAQYELFHRRWIGFAALHAPDQLLTALGGLHGIRSWSQVQAENDELRAVAEDAAHPASDAAARLRQSRESVNALRERIAYLVNRAGLGAQDLPALRAQERQAADARRQAEQALAQTAPDLAAGLGVLAGLTSERVLQGLQPDEAWLTIAPTEPPLALLLRPGHPALTVKLERLPEVAHACDGYCRAVRAGRQGSLRDARDFMGLEPEVSPVSASQWLEQARQLCTQAFWSPLAAQLRGVKRLHLVTAADQHELLLELGQPAELVSLQLLRYSGLAAYQRSLLPDVRAPAGEPLPLLVITDTAEHGPSPIPFTQLDAVVPLARGLARRVSAPELLEQLQSSAQPLAVVISAHGDVARPEDGRLGGGHVLLPDGVAVDPKTLATLRGRIGWLMWVSCWAARVVHGGQGEPYGSMNTLQNKGLQGGIGCLAPVSDFYSPLLSAAVWHERLQGQSTGAALVRAKWRLLEGDWAGMEEDLQALRQAYRGLMLQLLQPLREATTEEPGLAARDRLTRMVRDWPCPGAVRRGLQQVLVGHTTIDRVLGSQLPSHEDLVEQCLDNLLRPTCERRAELHDETNQLVDRQLKQLCAVVVSFGPG